MYRVEWPENALEELTAIWVRADMVLRKVVTATTYQIDQLLSTDPIGQSESRNDGQRILLCAPIGLTFQLEEDGNTVTVLHVWLFGRLGKIHP